MRKLLFLSVALLGMSELLTSCVRVDGDGDVEADGTPYWAKLIKIEQVIYTSDKDVIVGTITPSDAYYLDGTLLLKHEIYVRYTTDQTNFLLPQDYSDTERPTPDSSFSELLSKDSEGGKSVLKWRCYQYEYKGVDPSACTKVDRFKGIDIYQYNGKYYCYFDKNGQCFALNKVKDGKGNDIYWSCLLATYKFDRYPVQVL